MKSNIVSIPLSLDEILPNMAGKSFALFGDLSSKRNNLIVQFVLDGLQSEGTTCIVTLTRSATDMIDELSNFSPDAAMLVNDAILNERLQVIDMYSFRGIQQEEIIPGTHMMASADDLTLLSITINKISKAFPKCRIVIWPYSLLSIYIATKDMVNFTQTLSARTNARKQSTLLVADTGVINSGLRSILESIVDCVIETKRDTLENEVHESFRIKFFRGEDNMQYDVWTTI